MLTNSRNTPPIFVQESVSMSPDAIALSEVRNIVGEAVNARRGRGASEAVFQAARDLKMSERRVVSILRGEIKRVWAGEYIAVRDWYAHHCALEAERLAHEAVIYKQRVATLKERLK